MKSFAKRFWQAAQKQNNKELADKLEEAKRLRKEIISENDRQKNYLANVGMSEDAKRSFRRIRFLKRKADAIEEEVIKALRNQGGVK